MSAQGDRIFAAITAQGFPDPWSAFGECLSWESAHAVQLKNAIDQTRKDNDEQTRAAVEALFTLKQANLAKAQRLLADVTSDYDRKGTWAVLDERAARLDIDDVSERWALGLVEHPFPIALRSLQFNWRYMKDHGVRGFYEMTARYLEGLDANTRRWSEAWDEEAATSVIDRVTTVECDLASDEAPMHCDTCRKTSTALLSLDD